MNQQELEKYIRDNIDTISIEPEELLQKGFSLRKLQLTEEPLKLFYENVKRFMLNELIDEEIIYKDYLPIFNSISKEIRGSLQDQEEATFNRKFTALKEETIDFVLNVL
ncbi:hypothetical protein HMPREF9182_0590 [Streptococcus sp. oral taxon 056 str. F0418]|uniref:hypothetical protein n=1 Tax=Streptococcus sp. oral taxon 056 TaxID=712620 RepID=UPI00021806FC|nr:hypothetical protein [Streptococcus sp. oral taxon 056]EGP66886.1 hypothetical protein HMPREF9182_0590 [Streptococcus sp. oral taxon 056 str. F0418]